MKRTFLPDWLAVLFMILGMIMMVVFVAMLTGTSGGCSKGQMFKSGPTLAGHHGKEVRP